VRDDVAQALIRTAPGGTPNALSAEFRLDPALPVFRGHFPGRPLVPGVFEIEMVRLAVERHTGQRYRMARVVRAKFAGEVVPGDLVALTALVAPRDAGLSVSATLRVGDTTKGTVTVLLEPLTSGGGAL
jgi:3-hydroxyacyl-[acyl-carrier-protein] dehydratase